eukprot:TRINITY_DN2629_c0_g1_i2.p2 TRINITY_DN2629_c0_g1~~TRINITY_DN2629_c0_g1_i2.p2  ORF type:complete len:374 (+),score=69.63 TRINITY_DN2629_c0_g1_i2:1642-2763(+)
MGQAQSCMTVQSDKQIRAIQYEEYGDVDTLSIARVPMPQVGNNDVLVRVRAVSINPIDWKIRKGNLQYFVGSLPWVPGFDFSGEVVAVGSNVVDNERFSIGDEVYGMQHRSRCGTHAEYAVVDCEFVAKKPKSMTHEQAASLPLVGLTCWEALVTIAAVKEGDKVLIVGASGGAGSIAVQLAKSLGATVAGVCSGKNSELVASLGADVVIDYTKEDFSDVLAEMDYDVCVDCVGGDDIFHKSYLVLKNAGTYVTLCGPNPDAAVTAGNVSKIGANFIGRKFQQVMMGGLRYHFVSVSPSGAVLDKLSSLVEDGKIHTIIDSEYEFENMKDAYRRSESGRSRGKVVIKVQGKRTRSIEDELDTEMDGDMEGEEE